MDGIWFRIAVVMVGCLQVGVTALLGFQDQLPLEWKIVLVVASAMLVFLGNQLPSLQNAPRAARALRSKPRTD